MPRKRLSPEQKAAIREVSAIVTRLLAHYWTADDRVETRQAQIEDWVEDLIEFGPLAVATACRDWRRDTFHQRPLPGDIRALCAAAANAERERLMIEDQRRQRWPRWLEETWGPEPDGPRKRAEALAQRGEHANV